DSRFVDEGTSRIDCRSEQRAGVNSFAPFQYHWTAAQVHDRGHAVGEINRRITKIISCPHHCSSGHMDMRIRQTRTEVPSRADYDSFVTSAAVSALLHRIRFLDRQSSGHTNGWRESDNTYAGRSKRNEGHTAGSSQASLCREMADPVDLENEVKLAGLRGQDGR